MPACTLTWEAVSGATNYKVYCGSESGNYNEASSPVTVGAVTSYEYTVPTAGTWYFAVAAIVGGVEGELSQEFAYETEGANVPVGIITAGAR